MAIKAVIFDCFGVLYGGSIDTLIRMAEPEGKVMLRDLSKQHDYGFISGSEYESGIDKLYHKFTPAVR